MVALIQYHLNHLRRSPATGVFLAAGWVAAIFLTFVHGHFIAANQADLSLFFTYLPWVMAVLVATLTMPVATEGARGITERLATLPFTPFQRISARFQVYWLLMGFWLLGFAPLVATVYYLGSPDLGPLLTGFLGSWLLAAPLLAVSLLVCVHAKSAVGGLLGSLGANFALLLVGMPQVAGWFAQVPGFGWLPATSHVTLVGAYLPFTQGLLNMAALLLMLAVTLLALAGAAIGRSRLGMGGAGFVLLLAAMWPSLGWMQLDTTSESLHTPAPATVRSLQNLGVPATFTLHVSQNNPDVPPQVHATLHTLTNLLLNLRAQAPKKVLVRRNNTDASTAAAIRALQAGATEQALPTGTTYFAALEVDIGGNKAVMPVISPARQPVQEYDLMRLVEQARTSRKPTLTLVGDASAWQADVTRAFHVTSLVPALEGSTLPSPTDVLVLAQDIPLPKPTLTAIQTYLEQGGSVLMLADAYSRAYPQPEPSAEEAAPSSLLPQWGLALVSDSVVADPDLATMVNQPKAGAMPYPFWLTLQPANQNRQLPFLHGMGGVMLQDAGELKLLDERPLPVITALQTGQRARALPKDTFLNTEPALANTLLTEKTGPAATRILAALVQGPFVPAAPAGTLLVVADTDWLAPQALAQAPRNKELLINTLHALAGQKGLAALRAKGAAPHTFTYIEKMAASLARRSAQTEQAIAVKLTAVGPDAQEEAFTLRQQLRDIRAQTRQRLQSLENLLLAINLLTMPLLLGLWSLIRHVRAKRQARGLDQ